ncbi:MAG: ribosome biogenesis protein ytm1 [Cirrosporium novae-zelandiae]|nr:MAG: ribosome biogenesis protein ytm1 [Cirrosporium novae-zelandiae]
MDTDTTNQTGRQSQVRIHLSSRDPDVALPESPTILVPTGNVVPAFVNRNPTDDVIDLGRRGLSEIVNELLKRERIPFEFHINGTGSFLNTSIDEFLTANGISAETILDVEYIRALIPPVYIGSFEHDDWVSGVDILQGMPSGQERMVTASYDGFIRVWNMSSEVLATSSATGSAYMSSMTSAKFVTPDLVASGSLDRTLRLWKYLDAKPGDSTPASLTPKLVLYGHKESIDHIAIHRASHRMLSASADHSVGLWSTRKSDAPPAPTARLFSNSRTISKKQKTGANVPHCGPLALLESHTQQVTSTIFASNDATVGYSVSLDHTLKTWDLETTSLVNTRTLSHSLLSMEALPSLSLLAAGSMEQIITLIDPRASAQKVAAMTLKGHLNAVKALARDPHSEYGLVSGSYDGTCRIWDTRSTKTSLEGVISENIYTIPRQRQKEQKPKRDGDGVKVFDVYWDANIGIISAGEDKMVQINKGQEFLSKAN